jgi:hypothetical protein
MVSYVPISYWLLAIGYWLLAIGYSERFPVHAKQSYPDVFNAGHTLGGHRCDAIFHHGPEARRKSFYRQQCNCFLNASALVENLPYGGWQTEFLG